MNKNIAKPLIIQFTPPEAEPALKKSSKSLFVPVNTSWQQFKARVLPLVADPAYDSVLVHTRDDVNRDTKGVVGNMAIKLNALAGAGTKADKPVLTYEAVDKPFYFANPSINDKKAAASYAPADETILGKYNSYESDDAWQEHQDKIWGRMMDMMPLSRKTDQYNKNHAAQLKDPKRGLEDKDLDKFWSFKSGQSLAPTVMGDDMVGMPSVEGRTYDGFTMSINQGDGTVSSKPLQVRSLTTTGASGIAIPMANANGHVNKHQIAADLTPYGTALHFRAADGKTVAKGEVFDKKTREYNFNFADGTPAHLKVTAVAQDDTITLQDAHGIFNVKPKKEIYDVLKDRGYDVPEIITSVKAEQNGKYMWQSPGTMTGTEKVLKTVSPSNPGFINAREPKNGSDEYVVLVAEGALKGHIVAKYVDVKDKDGVCFGDRIAGDKGIIVTQVPGVAEAYVKNAVSIYDKYNVAGTYIAMDADGRENRNVAKGIHSAYNYISKYSKTTVLSWDPAQKGMDDALLAVAQGKITVSDMGIRSGSPEALFPIDQAHVMTPYTLDGTQTKTPSWVQEYSEQHAEREERIKAQQAETAAKTAETEEPLKEEPVKEEPLKETKAEQAGEWMATPENISNIQSITVTKAAEMADAMAGTVPAPKAEAKIAPTPDVDEKAAAEAADRIVKEAEDMANVAKDDETMKIARDWDSKNPAMAPIPVPHGYKAAYEYKQPVVEGNGVPNFRGDTNYEPQGSKWGIVTVKTDYEITPQEKGERQDELRKGGLEPVGNMRLTSQTFTNNKDVTNIKDLGDQFTV